IDEYIGDYPENVQERLEKIRRTIRGIAPGAVETISYQIPAFKVDGKFLVYFAAFPDHISIYPIPAGDDDFNKDIAPYVKGKGTLQFPLNKPIPFNLVEKIAGFHLLRREREIAARVNKYSQWRNAYADSTAKDNP
ncbi:MAG: DUF1801 domain-containing protein, partial [Dehalococcoidales bacterium]|nr:DUF1801 domain-containing protein [Dehalococcoidales bacterium]